MVAFIDGRTDFTSARAKARKAAVLSFFRGVTSHIIWTEFLSESGIAHSFE
jgi:hypothetical protein